MAHGPAGGAQGVAEGLPAGMFRMRRVPGMQVRMVRIELKALVQMAVVALVLYQVHRWLFSLLYGEGMYISVCSCQTSCSQRPCCFCLCCCDTSQIVMVDARIHMHCTRYVLLSPRLASQRNAGCLRHNANAC